MAQFFPCFQLKKYFIMIMESFNQMSEHQKVQLVFEADKITEKIDAEANYQLFKISNLFVEVKSSLEGKFKRSFTAYTLKELPVAYVGEVLSIPIVTLNEEVCEEDLKKLSIREKYIFYK